MSLKILWKKVDNFLQVQFVKTENIVILFSVFGLTVILLFYLINIGLYKDKAVYDSIGLRITMSVMHACLALKNYWPKSIRRWLPLCWYLSLLFALPYFFTLMMLKNHMAAPWILNWLAKVILMIIITDWILYAVLLTIGMSLAWLVFSLTSPIGFVFNPGTLTAVDIINTFVTSIVIGLIFSRRKTIYQDTTLAAEKARTDSMRLVSASIAHELRTPLQSIKLLAKGLKSYLPKLTETYNIAKQHKLDIPAVSKQHIDVITRGANTISLQVDHSMLVIDMLLGNLSFKNIERANFQVCSIAKCIDDALNVYPFSRNERELITWDPEIDFVFSGSANLVIQVLFNLIKNALYIIKATGRGNIKIQLQRGETFNKLFFEDTAKGIQPESLSHIFDKFFTKDTAHGAGIGLAFCKMSMKKHGGDITCLSEYGKYTRFILAFPVLDLATDWEQNAMS